jgi:hypothetical protein
MPKTNLAVVTDVTVHFASDAVSDALVKVQAGVRELAIVLRARRAEGEAAPPEVADLSSMLSAMLRQFDATTR